MGEKIKEQTFGRQMGKMNKGREIWGMKFKGEKIWDYKIRETLKRKKGEKNGTVKWGRGTGR